MVPSPSQLHQPQSPHRSPSCSAHLLALHRVELRRTYAFESIASILADPLAELSDEEREELERLKKATGSLEARRTFVALAFGWRRAVSCL